LADLKAAAVLFKKKDTIMLAIGELAPDFTLPDEQGNLHTLAALRGQNPVVLIFYPGDQTPVCTMQLCEVRDKYEEFTAAGAVVFGINPSDTQSHKQFAQRYNLQFHLLVDKDKQVAQQYQAVDGWGFLSITKRAVYLIGLDGRIIFAKPGRPNPAEILAVLPAGTSA